MRKGHLAPMQLLPCAPSKCQQCAVDHTADEPHNQQSIFYQYYFYNLHGRWPTWKDAMQHCSDETKANWVEELRKMGIIVA